MPDEAERAVLLGGEGGATEFRGDAPQRVVGSALRNSAVYAGASAFQRGLVFLLLPVYTRVLTPGEYGRLSVLLAIAGAAMIVLSFGMDTAFFRTYFALQSDPHGQRQFVATAWTFLLVVPPIVAGLLALAAAPVIGDGAVGSPTELALALAGAAIFVSGTVVPLALLRAEERLRDYLVLAAIAAGATAGFTLLAVVGLGGGVAGWLIAVIAANGVSLAAAVRRVPFQPRAGFNRRLLIGALTLGLPLVPHVLSQWGLGVSNRLVLSGMVSASKVGIYALAANIALPVAILMQSMAQGFMPSFARAATDDAALEALRQVIMVEFLLTLAITTAGALLAPIGVRLLAAPEYAGATELVPWLVLGYGLYGLYFIPMNAVSLTVGRTGKVWMMTAAAAAANLLCLVLLVPAIGLEGAAIAAPTGYLALLIGVTLYSIGPDNPVRYQRAKLARGVLVFAVVYGLAVATSGDRSASDACIRLVWLGSVPLLLVVAGVIDGRRLVARSRVLMRRG